MQQTHADVEVEILGGKSFIDDIFEAVKVDPNDGFTMLRCNRYTN
jgi:tetrapyrrole methylase family protein/MazG family protein